MNKAYTRINWQNQPSPATALGATNLNKMDVAINELDNRVVAMDTVVQGKANSNDIPTKTSQLTNDSGFLTEHQDITGKQDKSTLETDVSAKGFTKNGGTVTSVAVKMNGSTKGTVTSSGTINLGTVITSHQDISGKENTSNKVTSISSSSTDTQYPSAKCVYDLVGNIETLLEGLL